MPRSITVALGTAFAKPVTSPGYFVQWSGLSQPLRWNNIGGDLVWNGNTWVTVDFGLSGIAFDEEGAGTPTLDVNNLDSAVAALFLTDDLSGAVADIWQFERSALANLDPVIVGRYCIDDDAVITPTSVSLPLAPEQGDNAFLPRRRVDRYNGFTFAAPKNTRIPWGAEIFVIGEND
jgi:hypothetical protein